MNHQQSYRLLLVMFVLHFVAMYVLMYAMVDQINNVYLNHNQFYMAALMAAPMLLLEVLLMSSMYPKKKFNLIIVFVGTILLVGSLAFIRGQVAINDEQFLKSMIPHHAGAILMCEQANLADPEIKELCQNILSGQQSEIEWMTQKLDSLD